MRQCDDSRYYARRVRDEYRMAAAADDPRVASIHESMARAYEMRVGQYDSALALRDEPSLAAAL